MKRKVQLTDQTQFPSAELRVSPTMVQRRTSQRKSASRPKGNLMRDFICWIHKYAKHDAKKYQWLSTNFNVLQKIREWKGDIEIDMPEWKKGEFQFLRKYVLELNKKILD